MISPAAAFKENTNHGFFSGLMGEGFIQD